MDDPILLSRFAEVVAKFDENWPRNAPYPFPTRTEPDGVQMRSLRWRDRFLSSVFPLNGIDTYRGMKIFLGYLSDFSSAELKALSSLADLNLKQHDFWLATNPLTKLVGLVSALLASAYAMKNFRVIEIPAIVTSNLSPIIWAGVFVVALYIFLLVLLGPIHARARILRDLIEIALHEKECQLSAISAASPPPAASIDVAASGSMNVPRGPGLASSG